MKQLRDILFMQSFGIILVVLGHSFFHFPHQTLFLRWIHNFHMPLFFFISGYLLRYVHGNLTHLQLAGRKGYLTRKARRLLVPYVVLGGLGFVIKASMARFVVRPITFTLHDYLDQLLIPYHSVLGAYWFMPTLFLIFAVFTIGCMAAQKAIPGLTRRRAGLAVLVVLALVNCLMPFSHDSLLNIVGVIFYMFYFTLGYLFQASPLEAAIKRTSAPVLLAVTLALSVAVLFGPQNSLVDMLASVNGIVMTMALALVYERRGCHWLDHLYGYTYTIYLYHSFFQIFSLQVLLHFVSLPPVVYVPTAFLLGLYGPWVFSKVRHKMLHKAS